MASSGSKRIKERKGRKKKRVQEAGGRVVRTGLDDKSVISVKTGGKDSKRQTEKKVL
jgi:hypothetical protein